MYLMIDLALPSWVQGTEDLLNKFDLIYSVVSELLYVVKAEAATATRGDMKDFMEATRMAKSTSLIDAKRNNCKQ